MEEEQIIIVNLRSDDLNPDLPKSDESGLVFTSGMYICICLCTYIS
jgi:hypothetical protein